MEYVFLILGLYFLIFYFPWYVTFLTEEGYFKCYLIMFGFIRVPIDLNRLFKGFATRKINEIRGFNFTEFLENYKKILSIRPIYKDLARKAMIKELHWYTALPMENPVLGLSVLPIYTTVQSYLLEEIIPYFKKLKDIDVDSKYNYLNNDIFIYFSCIIKINLAKIIIVSVKYITKIPLLLKRST